MDLPLVKMVVVAVVKTAVTGKITGDDWVEGARSLTISA